MLAILGDFFLKKLNAHCAKTNRGSLVFSTVTENPYHKNVTVNYIALVKLVHNNLATWQIVFFAKL